MAQNNLLPLDLGAADMRVVEQLAQQLGTTADEAASALVRAGIQRRYVDQPRERRTAARVVPFERRKTGTSA